MLNEKYVYGLSNQNDGALVLIAKKDDWVDSGIYSHEHSEDLIRLMDYLGYDNDYFDLGFVNDSEIRHKLLIIDHLNKYPLLEYNEDFDKFASTYVYSFTIDKVLDRCAICVTPKVYWIKEHDHCSKKVSPIISNFLVGLGLKEIGTGIFKFSGEVKAPYILSQINKMKYLQHDSEFQCFIED